MKKIILLIFISITILFSENNINLTEHIVDLNKITKCPKYKLIISKNSSNVKKEIILNENNKPIYKSIKKIYEINIEACLSKENLLKTRIQEIIFEDK